MTPQKEREAFCAWWMSRCAPGVETEPFDIWMARAALADAEQEVAPIMTLEEANKVMDSAWSAIMDAEIHQPSKCKCEDGWASLPSKEICAAFEPSMMKHSWCHTCGHDEACHAPTDSPTNTGDGK